MSPSETSGYYNSCLMYAQAYLACDQAVLRNAYSWLKLAHLRLGLKQQLLRARYGDINLHNNISI